jgi:DtxR family Mn-dependent transcriptional regulator
MHQSPMDERVEEILELIWVLREEDIRSRARLTELAPSRSGEADPTEVLAELVRRALLQPNGDALDLSAGGEAAAETIVRRHRLAERLLSDVLDMDEVTTARDACRLEHVLSPGVTESICTLLGHPPVCPHERPIPRGDCCRTANTQISPLIVALAKLGPGEGGIVRFVSGGREGIERLLALGLAPGVKVQLSQRRPAYVVEIGQTTIAIDGPLAHAIFVSRWPRFLTSIRESDRE